MLIYVMPTETYDSTRHLLDRFFVVLFVFVFPAFFCDLCVCNGTLFCRQVAEDVRHHHPDDFSTLCKYRIHHEYAEPQHHLRSLDPILKVHPLTLQLEYIRYNQYDRAPLSAVPTADIKKVYSAIGRLGRMLSLPENEFWLKLRPGTVLFVDNWRVLHGRAAFTGSRRMTGCYLPRDDWIGKARILDLVWR